MEDFRNESSGATNTFVTLIEQTTLLLGQASPSISYTRLVYILKTLLKDLRKAKTLLKEKTAILQESESHVFGKKFRSHIIEVERSKKQSLGVFKGSHDKNNPFQKSPRPYQNRPRGGGRYYYTAKSSNRDQNKNILLQNNASAIARKLNE